jgi:hypothetical protein
MPSLAIWREPAATAEEIVGKDALDSCTVSPALFTSRQRHD